MICSLRYLKKVTWYVVILAFTMVTPVQKCGWYCQPSKLGYLCLIMAVFYVLVIWEGAIPLQDEHSPSPLSSHPLYPSPKPLLDLKDFSYIINNDVCGRDDVFITVIVHTHPANRERRDIMRKYIPSKDLHDLGMRRVFLLARAEWSDQELYQKVPQEYIVEENTLHNDIVQGNFKEHYHNLTYKHIMGLQWATRYCPMAQYILKMDDDIVVDLYQYRDRLKTRYFGRKNFLLGLLQLDSRPVRDKKSKWYVSEAEYQAEYYAPFVSGWAYAMSLDAAVAIVQESHKLPYFWIDDVHITGTLAERVKVKKEAFNRFYTLHVEHLHCCVEQLNSSDYYCDYFVGPSEGDFEVMSRVLAHARSCYINPCMYRVQKSSISRTCVVSKARPYAPLGNGRGEIVRVSNYKQEGEKTNQLT